MMNETTEEIFVVVYSELGKGWRVLAFTKEEHAKRYARDVRRNLGVMPNVVSCVLVRDN